MIHRSFFISVHSMNDEARITLVPTFVAPPLSRKLGFASIQCHIECCIPRKTAVAENFAQNRVMPKNRFQPRPAKCAGLPWIKPFPQRTNCFLELTLFTFIRSDAAKRIYVKVFLINHK